MTLEIFLLRLGGVGAITGTAIGASLLYLHRRIKIGERSQEQASHYKTLEDFAKTVQYVPHKLALDFLVEEEHRWATSPPSDVLEGTITNILLRDLDAEDKFETLADYHQQILTLRESRTRWQGLALSLEEREMNHIYKSGQSRFAAGFAQWLYKCVEADAKLLPNQKNNALGLAGDLIDLVDLNRKSLDNAINRDDWYNTASYFWKEFEPALLKLTQALEPQKVLAA